jgi:hypothetical protein
MLMAMKAEHVGELGAGVSVVGAEPMAGLEPWRLETHCVLEIPGRQKAGSLGCTCWLRVVDSQHNTQIIYPGLPCA